jgi:anti-anti-sigma factor
MTLTEPSPTAPALGVVVLHGEVDAADSSRLGAELAGRIAVGTQVLIVDVGRVELLDAAVLGVMAEAAKRLHDERSGSFVLRNASARLLRQLRLMRLDHVFELEI